MNETRIHGYRCAMAQKSKPPRLYLRSRKGADPLWVIRHKQRMIATGFGEADVAKAAELLETYCAALDLEPETVQVSYRSLRQPGFIYFASCEAPGFPIKIGWSTDVNRRLRSLQCALPFKVRLLGMMPGTLEDEHTLHVAYARQRLEGEWFQRSEQLLTHISWHKNKEVA